MGMKLSGGATNAYEQCQLKGKTKPVWGFEFTVTNMYLY
jgi:hypothetical protein